MPHFPYHIAPDRDTPLPPVAELPTVEADEPIDPLAVAEKLGREGRLPSEVGVTFWFRLVLGERNGRIQVAEVPLTPTAKGLQMRVAGIDEKKAFHRLQALASAHNQKLVEAARSVIALERAHDRHPQAGPSPYGKRR